MVDGDNAVTDAHRIAGEQIQLVLIPHDKDLRHVAGGQEELLLRRAYEEPRHRGKGEREGEHELRS